MNDSAVASVGIDVGKAKLDVSYLRGDGSASHQIFSNTKNGIGELARSLIIISSQA